MTLFSWFSDNEKGTRDKLRLVDNSKSRLNINRKAMWPTAGVFNDTHSYQAEKESESTHFDRSTVLNGD